MLRSVSSSSVPVEDNDDLLFFLNDVELLSVTSLSENPNGMTITSGSDVIIEFETVTSHARYG